MGGGNSVENYITATNTAIQKNIIRAVQKNAQGVDIRQLLNVDCEDLAKEYNNCIKILEAARVDEPEEAFIEEVGNLCQVSQLSCSADHIIMNQTVNANQVASDHAGIKSTVNSTAAQDLTSIVKEESGLLEFGNDVQNKIDATAKVVQDAVARVFTENFDNDKIVQQLSVRGGKVSFVTQTQLLDYVSKNVVDDKIVSRSVADLSQAVFEKSTSESGISSEVANRIIVGFIGVLLLVVLFIFMLKRTRRPTAPPAPHV
jgi:hypothetical protein